MAAILTLSVWPEAARGDARWVRFATASHIPSALALRRAAERGRAVDKHAVTPMRGLLVVPRGEGPFPAVVMVHGCRGVRPFVQEWARTVASWGYVTLLVDSFYTRHTPPTCNKLGEWSGREAVSGRVFDAYGALEYLSTLAFIANDRVAVMGWSHGAPLSAVSAYGARAFYSRHFKAAIALTPGCEDFSTARFLAPLLVLAAGLDDWTPAESCRRMAEAARSHPTPVSLHVYPQARHGFDDAELLAEIRLNDVYNPYRQPARGATLGYHGESHRDAVDRVRHFLLEHLGTGNADDDTEVYALVPSIREPPASTWVVDPDQPGPNLPPTGRSLFDLLFVKQTDDGPVYDLPFPFTRLLEHIEAPLRGQGSRQPILKTALIPFGRSLQRHTAAPEYFKYPRMVVAVDTEPRTYSDAQAPIMLKDRLFLGYQEKSGVIEVISYNERAARFEFQVVTDYRADGTPQVTYAQRTICTSCHQNGAPLFAEAGWDETNTNSRVAEALAEERRIFYGVSVDRCCAVSPVAIDNATDRANLFSAYQMLWQDGCRNPESASFSARCRGGAFTAMLQHRLSAYSHFDTGADLYREYFRPLFTRNWRHNWPDGLNIPNPNIPNRKPLLSPRPTYISAELDPLKRRSPLAVWRVHKARDRQRMITGFAEFLPTADIERLDTFIYDKAVRENAERQRLSRICPISRQDLLDGAELLVVRCEDEPAAPAGPFELLADLVYDGDSSMRGSLVRLELAQSELFTNLQLTETTVLRRGRSKRARLEVLQRRHQTRVRRADGNAIAVFDLHWPDAAGEGKLEARITLEIIGDFAPVHAAVTRLVDDDDSILSSEEPFRGTRAMQELLAALDLAPTPWCCSELPPMPPVKVDDDSEPAAQPSLQSSADVGVPAAFYDRCGSCHRGNTLMPPGFMHGTPQRVADNLSQCAERIYVRLGMWQVREGARAKSPMPPVVGIPSANGLWHGGDEYRLMLNYVGGVLKARRGVSPDLDDLVARGYENLQECPPASG